MKHPEKRTAGAKALAIFQRLAARLKSCPVTRPLRFDVSGHNKLESPESDGRLHGARVVNTRIGVERQLFLCAVEARPPTQSVDSFEARG